MKKMKLKHYLMIITIISIILLYFLSKLSQAPLINIYEIQNYNGKQVIVEGIVTDNKLTKYDNQIITIENNNTKISIFCQEKTEVDFGDKIQAKGEVQKYKGDWELFVDGPSNIKIIEKGKNISFPLWQIAQNPSKYINQNISVTGFVESISNSYFCIVDFEKKIFLPVIYDLGKNITIYPGQKVIIFGRFSFDEKNFRYKIEINKEGHYINPLEGE